MSPNVNRKVLLSFLTLSFVKIRHLNLRIPLLLLTYSSKILNPKKSHYPDLTFKLQCDWCLLFDCSEIGRRGSVTGGGSIAWWGLKFHHLKAGRLCSQPPLQETDPRGSSARTRSASEWPNPERTWMTAAQWACLKVEWVMATPTAALQNTVSPSLPCCGSRWHHRLAAQRQRGGHWRVRCCSTGW